MATGLGRHCNASSHQGLSHIAAHAHAESAIFASDITATPAPCCHDEKLLHCTLCLLRCGAYFGSQSSLQPVALPGFSHHWLRADVGC
eukprot:6199527-Pleurochrysis_carterae.AAC.2